MKLIQWNLRMSIQMTVTFLIIFAIVGFLYETRMGYELRTPPPLPTPAIAPEAREGVVPKPCVAYRPESASWGYENGNCPKGYAMFANHEVGGANKQGPGELVRLHGLCCPLPADDILTNRHTYSEFERCPDQYVATGGAGHCDDSCTMRCTQINTERYTLGPETMAYYVKDRNVGRLHGQGSAIRIHWQQTPIAIRYGLLRLEHNLWTGDGCMGVPPGSLLVRKSGKRCDGFFYRELQYRDGTPVKMLPDCAALSDPYHPNPQCLGPEDAHKAAPVVPE